MPARKRAQSAARSASMPSLAACLVVPTLIGQDRCRPSFRRRLPSPSPAEAQSASIRGNTGVRPARPGEDIMNKLWLGAAVLIAAATNIAQAEDYPTRTVTIIVPFAPGGPADITGRVLADILSRHL